MTAFLRITAFLVPALLLTLIVDGVVSGLSPARPLDAFMVLTVWLAASQAWKGNKLAGMLAGAAIGLTQDALLSSVFGVHFLSKLVVGYVTTLVALRLIPNQTLSQGVLIAGATLLEIFVILVTGVLLGQQFGTRSPSEYVALLVLNVLFGGLLFAAAARWRGLREGRRAHAPRGG